MWWNSGSWWTHYQGGINEMENNEKIEEFNVKAEAAFEEIKGRLANNVKKYRTGKGWTQKQFAEKIGRDAQSIYMLESKSTFPTGETLSKICVCFKISIEQLFEEHDKHSYTSYPDVIQQLSDEQKAKLKDVIDFIQSNL